MVTAWQRVRYHARALGAALDRSANHYHQRDLQLRSGAARDVGFPPAGATADRGGQREHGRSVAIACAHGAQVLALAENEGFGRACNRAAALATTPFLFFLNPDARLDADCLVQLLLAAERYPDASAFNPRITNAEGHAFFRRSSVLLPRSEWMPRGCPEKDQQVGILSGAALFCRRELFQRIGGFDPALFLYYEDDDLALRLKQHGPLMFIHAAIVRHMHGLSSPRTIEIARIKTYHDARSRVYVMRKHGRPWPLLRSLLKSMRGVLSPVVLLSPRQRAKALSFLRGVCSTIANPPGAEKRA